jgi:RNA polymerase sigma-32 factor
MNRVRRYPKLEREDEAALGRAWLEQHDRKAADRLLEAHLRYVVSIALRFRRYGFPISELIAEGNVGLLRALDKYDPARGNRLVTYASYWIRAYILNYIIRSWSLVGGGTGVLRSKLFFKLRRERVKITNVLGEGPEAHAALAEKLNVPWDALQSMLQRLDVRDASTDAQLFDDAGTTLGDTLRSPDPNQEEAVAAVEGRTRAREVISEAMSDLDTRETFIVQSRIMAHSDDSLSLAEIGRRLGISRERARQLEARALRKLKVRVSQLARPGESWTEWAA